MEIQNGFPCIPINQVSEEERGGSGACWILWQRGRALIGERAFIPGNRVSEELNLIACSSQMDIKTALTITKVAQSEETLILLLCSAWIYLVE